MNKLKEKLLLAAAGFAMSSAMAEGFDGSDPLLCSVGHVIECIDGKECRTVAQADVDAPDFVKLDLGKKKFSSVVAGIEGAQRDLGSFTDTATHLIVQGAQGGDESARDALGWSLTIDKESGQAVISAAGDNAAFVLFGACMPL